MQLGDYQQRCLAYSTIGFVSGMALLNRYRRNPHLINQSTSYGMAAKALVVGSLLSVSTVGIAIILGSAYLGINTMEELRLLAKASTQDDFEIMLVPKNKK